ncbi:MAG: tetratricopeptide repeat protein [Ferruginibacter sp.]|nr:tetratricopeptide repeat protein [Ferruginibacter sp.]
MKKLFLIGSIFLSTNIFAKSFIDSSQYFFAKGIEEKKAKHYLVASNYFDKAIGFNKSFTEAYLESAIVNNEMRRTDQAKASLLKAHELQPTNIDVVKELTNVFYDYHQWDKAIEFANKCTNCANADRILGMSFYNKEDYMQAEKYLLKAITKDPSDAQATYTIARNYMDADQYLKAVPFFEKAVSLSPDKNVWAYELGLLYYNNNNFRSAVTAFENAAKNGYHITNDYTENYGYSLMYSGQFAKGEEKLMEIYAKNGNKELLRELSQILYSQKQYDRSLDYSQKLLEADAKDGKALYQAGLSFIKLGKKAKGQSMCDKAIELDPTLASKKSTVGGGENDFGL